MSDAANALRLQLAKLSPSERARLLERLGQTAGAEAGLPESSIPRRSEDGPAPLTYNQEILWTLDQALPGLTAYNVPRVLRIEGPLDVGALQVSLDALVERHESLRTRFHSRGGVPEQIVGAAQPVAIRTEDLSALGAVDRGAALDECIRARIADRFDLAREQLLHATLVRLGTEEHVLILLTHHIVCDEWSRDVLYRELGAFYSAARTARTAALPPLPIRYTDYAAWQRQPVQEAGTARALDYWRDRLKHLATLEIPTDYPRSGLPSFEGARVRFEFPAEVIECLRALARAEGTTLYVALLTVYVVLLHRYTAQDDIVVGSPVSTRSHDELEGLIGYFPSLMILRTAVSGDSSFRSLMQQVKDGYLDAFEHREVPLEQLALDIRERDRAPAEPLVRVSFQAQEGAGATARLEGAEVTQIQVDPGTAKFELLLALQETAAGWQGVVEYRTDLFARPTIDRMITHFERLAQGAGAAPDAAVSALPLMPDSERRQVLVAWNATTAPFPANQTLPELFRAVAAASPAAPAVEAGATRLTFAELDARIDRLAVWLETQGIGPGALVGVYLDRGPELVPALLAILRAGAAYVPIDPLYPAARVAWMMEDAAMPMILTRPGLAEALPSGAARIVPLDETGWPLGAGASTAGDRPSERARPEGLAYVIYTSGSTGRPKGAMIHHRGLVNYLWWAKDAYEVAGGQGSPVHSSIAFDLTITSLFVPLLAGRPAILLADDQGVDALADCLRTRRDLSLVKLTPAHLEALRHRLSPEEAAGRTRRFIIGGENLTGEALAFWQRHAPDTRLVNEYGPTETVVGCCIETVSDSVPIAGSVPIGRPIANTQLYVLDRRREPVPIGIAGELYIGGEGVGLGYLNAPERTAETFLPDPFAERANARLYRTGDRARWRGDGRLEFLGRLDEQVKLRGYRIELGEIEAVLTQHPSVRAVSVQAQSDGAGDPRLVAYVVAAPDQVPAEAATLIRYLAERLPSYMVPSAFVPLAELPLTPNGKVDRARLHPPALTRSARDFVPPRSGTEAAIAAIWTQVLRIESVGSDDRFLDLGGQSLQAMRILGRIREVLGVTLPLSLLLRDGSVAELGAAADAATAARDAEEDGLVAVSREGFKRPGSERR